MRLSTTEFSLLARLIASEGTVVTSRELLEIGWGAEYRDAVSHLESVMDGLAQKLGLRGGRNGIVKSAGIGHRYIPVTPTS